MIASISDALNQKQAARSFHCLSDALPISRMKTIADIRLENLELLIEEIGSGEAVAEKAGTSPVYLSQLRHKAIDSKTGKPRQIGDPLARKLEGGCGKEVGWMDNSHQLATHRDIRIANVLKIMKSMEDWQIDQATKIIDTLAQPAPRRSNGD